MGVAPGANLLLPRIKVGKIGIEGEIEMGRYRGHSSGLDSGFHELR
jgi:hypothetical protein